MFAVIVPIWRMKRLVNAVETAIALQGVNARVTDSFAMLVVCGLFVQVDADDEDIEVLRERLSRTLGLTYVLMQYQPFS